MAAGTVHGDFIYTFVKPITPVNHKVSLSPEEIKNSIRDAIDGTIESELIDGSEKTISELYIAVLRKIIPLLAKLALIKESYDLTSELISGKMIEGAIRRLCTPIDKNLWRLEK